MQATLAALSEVADLGWFERVIRPFPVLDRRNVVEDMVFERTPVTGYRDTLPAFREGFSAAYGLLCSV